ncbi:NAD(P)/FAD-dependent oxidoreductase [Actinokineospora pegani]|uniref:NAD(P)/FAD-dependent oxidoreductase n=1 Tax=Actinokineospora pegani TaxID=2654637 RepID=UPI0012EA2E54|nr:FAD-dependent oxidoreductase [Actinokineospora pegani]
MPAQSLGHVVVLGGGVAGLLAAHVLARHAERVTVVERDHPGAGPAPRPGVPQSRHTHVLLTSGIDALDALLPGLPDEVRAAGGPRLDIPGDVGVWQGGQWVNRRNPSRPVLTASRPLFEHVLRERVLSGPGIEVLASTEVVGLTGDPGAVTGVVLRERGEQARPTGLAADLVVDATGRSSRLPRWWAELGGGAVEEDLLETGRAYATCVFESDDAPPQDIGGFYLVPEAGQPLGAIVLPAEGDRWMVTLSGPRGQAPPADVAGFVDFARLLPHDAPHKWLSTARAVGRPSGYRHTANRRRRWDRALRRTTGLLVVGDALSAFNPVYGQGLSVSALNAVALRDALDRSGEVSRWQRAVLRSGAGAWVVATGADSPMPGAEGGALRSGPVEGVLNRYLARVRDRVPGDPVVCAAFRDVLFLLAPPTSLLTTPGVLRRALLSPVVPTPPDLPTR